MILPHVYARTSKGTLPKDAFAPYLLLKGLISRTLSARKQAEYAVCFVC